MGVCVHDIMLLMEELTPQKMAAAWDNVGLIIGRRAKPVKSIMLALDITPAVVRQAIEHKSDLIITHHPPIFAKLGRITDAAWQQELLLTLAEHGIAVFSAHTNLDCVSNGVNDVLAARLKLRELEPLDEASGLGRIGLSEIEDLDEFAAFVKKSLKADYVAVGSAGKKVARVAVCGGSGADLIDVALQKGADTLVTGDLKYHQAQNAVFSGLNIIDAGHQATELPVLDKLADRLSLRFAERNVHIVFNVAAEALLLRHI